MFLHLRIQLIQLGSRNLLMKSLLSKRWSKRQNPSKLPNLSKHLVLYNKNQFNPQRLQHPLKRLKRLSKLSSQNLHPKPLFSLQFNRPHLNKHSLLRWNQRPKNFRRVLKRYKSAVFSCNSLSRMKSLRNQFLVNWIILLRKSQLNNLNPLPQQFILTQR